MVTKKLGIVETRVGKMPRINYLAF